MVTRCHFAGCEDLALGCRVQGIERGYIGLYTEYVEL